MLDSVRYAGIISVGCHGTSKDFGSIADLVESLTAVDGSGRLVVYNATHPFFSQAWPLRKELLPRSHTLLCQSCCRCC